ncbi:M56 family metallopeptidase [Aeoliella sp. SH292]|uniref:M56 family metallopeptidase n=1 Tax=Aeoliella sp. SH292 TaxID=3454464 RepID=UPI003F9B5A61
MNFILDCLLPAYYYACIATLASLPLLAIVLLFDLIVGRWLGAAIRSLLWTLVALRMLIPIGLPNTAGLPNLGWAVLEGGSPHESASHRSPVQPRPDSPPVIPGEQLVQHVGSDLIMATTHSERAPTPQPTNSSTWDWEMLVVLGILLIWPVVAFSLFGRAVVASVRFALRLRRIPSASDPLLLEVLGEVCQTMLIRRAPKVKFVPELTCPALFGCLRPTLCLPVTADPPSRNELPRNELRMVLIHELAHLVRYDGYVAWLLKLVQAVHWFNPLAWFVTRQVAHTRELACDEAVRRFTTSAEHPSYGELIVRFASAKPSINLGLIGLWFARPMRRLKSRIAACAPGRQRRWRLPRPVALVLLAIVACVGLTDRAPSSVIQAPAPPQPIEASPEIIAAAEVAMARHRDPRPAGSDIVEEREYDVADALEKLSEADPKADALEWLLTHIRPDGNDSPKPALVSLDRTAGRLKLRMTRYEHANFADALTGIERSGPWNVEIQIRFFRVATLEELGDLTWELVDAPAPFPDSSRNDWQQRSENEAALSMTSVTTSSGPFTTSMLSHDQMRRAVRSVQSNRRSNILNAPRVLLANGTSGFVRDQSFAPYVTGLARSRDPQQSQLEPVVSVLSEGTLLELRGDVVDASTLELSCRATFSEIESVTEGRLPGFSQVFQVPQLQEVVVQAHHLRFSPGETLVVAPIARLQDRDKPVDSLCFALTPIWTPATMPSPSTTSPPAQYIDETK